MIAFLKLVLGLWKHRAKFTDEALADLRDDQKSEWHCFILEHTWQVGFEHIDDNADIHVCTSAQIVDLVAPYKRAAEEKAAEVERLKEALSRTRNLAFDRAIEIVDRTCGVGKTFLVPPGWVRDRLVQEGEKMIAQIEAKKV